jgi:hypothetical protein
MAPKACCARPARGGGGALRGRAAVRQDLSEFDPVQPAATVAQRRRLLTARRASKAREGAAKDGTPRTPQEAWEAHIRSLGLEGGTPRAGPSPRPAAALASSLASKLGGAAAPVPAGQVTRASPAGPPGPDAPRPQLAATLARGRGSLPAGEAAPPAPASAKTLAVRRNSDGFTS